MSSHSDDEMDVPNEGRNEGTGPKEPQSRSQAHVASPPRSRTESPFRSIRTPPPPPPPPPAPFIRPRAETPTMSETPGIHRTLSSPSLMDSSPKAQQGAAIKHADTGSTCTTSSRSPIPMPYSPAAGIFSRKHNELTPITRNTSAIGRFVDDDHVVVSPEDIAADDDALHGEHLAFPSQSTETAYAQGTLKRRSSTGVAPSLPPLHMTERAKSMGNVTLTSTLLNDDTDDDDDVSVDEDNDYLMPVKFPSDRKYYSFTCQQQFIQSTSQSSSTGEASHLKPYQPNRGDDINVGVSSQNLTGIFQDAIPIEERQWSTPSIRLANHLNGSTTSYTDEEDTLGDEEASLSSRGSSLCLPDDEHVVSSSVAKLRLSVSTSTPKVAFHHQDHDDGACAGTSDEEHTEKGASRVKKRTRRRERQAFEWLRSVESTNEAISEAASSKFLTSTTQVSTANRRRSYHRNTSSPLEEQLASGFPPPSDTFPPSTQL